MKRFPPLVVALLLPCVALRGQDAAPRDRTEVNNPGARSSMMVDSPAKFPAKGEPRPPRKFPPDVEVASHPVEKDYVLEGSPKRSLAQIAAIQAEMPKGAFTVPRNDWRHLARTRRLLEQGGDFHLLALGDSIVNDTMRSGWIALLREAYPKANIKATVYVRGGGGCRHFWVENRIQNYLLPQKPDLVFIGGISQQRNYEAIRSVIRQIRAGLPECEFLLASGVFGSIDPRSDEAMAKAHHSGTSDYGRELQAIAAELRCAYFDMTTPWIQYMRSANVHPHVFYRDVVHANEYGEQILAKILIAWWAPPGSPGRP